MPELLITIFVFYLIYLYMTMKKSNVSAEKPVSKANAEQAAVAVVTEVKTKQPSTTPAAAKKAQPVKPALKAKAEKTATVTAKTAKPETSKPPLTKAPVKPKPETAKVVAATTELSMSDRVGLTAGSVWGYLNSNGSTSVAKLVQALPEEEKIIQRSIGWLAQEGKILLDTHDKIETISLID